MRVRAKGRWACSGRRAAPRPWWAVAGPPSTPNPTLALSLSLTLTLTLTLALTLALALTLTLTLPLTLVLALSLTLTLTRPELLPMLDLAHSVFNAVTGVDGVAERAEVRAFRPVLEWLTLTLTRSPTQASSPTRPLARRLPLPLARCSSGGRSSRRTAFSTRCCTRWSLALTLAPTLTLTLP